MIITIKAKNLELTEEFKNFIEGKFSGLKKFINILKREDEAGKTLAEVFVEIEKETKHHQKGNIFFAEVQVRLPGRKLFARAKSDDMFNSIVKAKNELKLEIEKYKFKNIDRSRRKQKKLKGQIIK